MTADGLLRRGSTDVLVLRDNTILTGDSPIAVKAISAFYHEGMCHQSELAQELQSSERKAGEDVVGKLSTKTGRGYCKSSIPVAVAKCESMLGVYLRSLWLHLPVKQYYRRILSAAVYTSRVKL